MYHISKETYSVSKKTYDISKESIDAHRCCLGQINASSCTLARAPQLLWVDLHVRLSCMFPASSLLHFTTTIISPPMFPAALQYYAVHSPTQTSCSSHPVVHTPPLTIILALALTLNKLHNNNNNIWSHQLFCVFTSSESSEGFFATMIIVSFYVFANTFSATAVCVNMFPATAVCVNTFSAAATAVSAVAFAVISFLFASLLFIVQARLVHSHLSPCEVIVQVFLNNTPYGWQAG
jgi:hypothetical protein